MTIFLLQRDALHTLHTYVHCFADPPPPAPDDTIGVSRWRRSDTGAFDALASFSSEGIVHFSPRVLRASSLGSTNSQVEG